MRAGAKHVFSGQGGGSSPEKHVISRPPVLLYPAALAPRYSYDGYFLGLILILLPPQGCRGDGVVIEAILAALLCKFRASGSARAGGGEQNPARKWWGGIW